MMKTKVFFLGQFLISSTIRCESGQSLFSSHSPFLYPYTFRCFGTKSISNFNSREKMKNMNGLDDAIRLYQNMSRMRPLPSLIHFNNLLSRIVKLKEYSSAINLFKDLRNNLGISGDVYTMNIAINCYCVSNRADFGFSILGWFFKRGLVPDVFTFNTLLNGCFRENKISEGQKLFKKMVKEELCRLNIVTYGTVIDGLCKAGNNTSMAIELLGEMEKERRVCKPNTEIYNMVIEGLCKDEKIDSALKLFDEMSAKGITRDVVTYNALVCGLCNLSRWDEAKRLIEEMIGYTIYPNVVTFSSLVDALCKEGLVDEAEDVISIMKQQNMSPDIVIYNALMDGYCRNGQVERALLMLDALEQKGENLHISYYNIVMDGFCDGKKVDAARDIFRELASKGLEPDVVTYNIMIKGCCQNGLLEEAKDILLKMEQASVLPNEITYNCFIQGNLKGGKFEDASKFLEEMDDKGFSLDASTFELLLDALGTTEQNPTIFKMIQKWAPPSASNENE
ncbi:hypothetical protein CASFOL_021052 [Castilleja foliolosa]|uniref:Pentatricopeptide repeat-containing protein n=1 Tax=Castilleja foliolosa TaxID=1961234 RepID=A0ABD3CVF3_9LAMI